MTTFEKWVQGITAGVAVLTFVWSIISIIIIYKQNKKLALLQGKIERGNHVSRTVFDSIFNAFQKLSTDMFYCYNYVGRDMFPYFPAAVNNEYNPHYDQQKMETIYELTRQRLDEVIKQTQLNRFILDDNIIVALESFDLKMQEVLEGYAAKIKFKQRYSSQKEKEMQRIAEELQNDYKFFSRLCFIYIQELQIVE